MRAVAKGRRGRVFALPAFRLTSFPHPADAAWLRFF
jgi:hypothetical protein